MKRLALILLAILIAVPVLAESCEDALEKSTELLIRANSKIEELEAEIEKLKSGNELKIVREENKFLKKQILSYEVVIAEASKALAESNIVLQKSYDRIDKDGDEIKELRGHIRTLITAGVEVKTYDWNVMITAGYPASLGVAVAYNLPFFTSLGVTVGVDYNIDTNTPALKAGIKINIGKD